MPQIKLQNSDGQEHRIIAPAVFGLGVAKETDTCVVKMFSTCQEETDRFVVATVRYLFENHTEVFAEEIRKLIRESLFSERKS